MWTGFPEFVTLQDRVTDAVYTLDDSGAILTEKMATELDVEPGDALTIRDDDLGDLEVKVQRGLRELHGALPVHDAGIL